MEVGEGANWGCSAKGKKFDMKELYLLDIIPCSVFRDHVACIFGDDEYAK
jgi:hypothetical protein